MGRFFFVLLLLLQFSVGAVADQLFLTNGDRLSGSIVKAGIQGLEMKTDLAGKVKLDWGAIQAIATTQPVYVTLATGEIIHGILTPSGGQETIRGPHGTTKLELAEVQAIRSATEQKSYLRLQNPGLLQLWAGSIDAGLSVAQGNTDIVNFNAGVKLARTTRQDQTSVFLTSLFNQGSGLGPNTTARAIRSGIRYDRNLSERLYGFGFTDFDSDALQELDLRNVLGGGLGWRVKKSEKLLVDLFSGTSFDQEFFSSLSRRTAESIVGQDVNCNLSDRSILTERLAVFPNLSNLGQYRGSFDATATTKLNSLLNWQVSVSDRYLSYPVAGAKRNDLVLTTGLSITFGQLNPFHSGFNFDELLPPTQQP